MQESMIRSNPLGRIVGISDFCVQALNMETCAWDVLDGDR